MKFNDKTMLITGGGSGIGRAYAEAFHRLGNTVIVAGRTQKSLDDVTSGCAGMKSYIVDMTDGQSIRKLAEITSANHPRLDVVFNVAGIMRPERLLEQQPDLSDAIATVETNFLGPIRLIAALLPTLSKQPSATIVTVSSGLGFLPMASTPTYSATKAAIHSYTESLRYQLRDTAIDVCEIIPPYVATSLMGERQANDERAMPLDEFISESMELLSREPTPSEINVQRVLPLRFAEANGKDNFDAFFKQFNDSVTAAAHG